MGGRNNGLGGISGGWTGPNGTPGQVGGISGGWPTGGGNPGGGINPQTMGIRGGGGTNYNFSPPPPAQNLGQVVSQPPAVNKEEPALGPPQPAVANSAPILAQPPAVNQAEAKPAVQQEKLPPEQAGYHQWGAKPINRGLGLQQPQATTSQDGSAQGPSGGGVGGGPGQWGNNQAGFDAFKAGRANDKPGPAGYGGGGTPYGYAWEGAASQQPQAVWSNARTGQNYSGVNQPGGTVNQMPPQQNQNQPSQPGKGQGEVGGYNQQGVQGGRMGIKRQTPGQWW